MERNLACIRYFLVFLAALCWPLGGRATETEGHTKFDELVIGLQEDMFLDRAHPPAGITDYTMLGGQLKTHSDRRLINGTLELGGSYAVSIENYSYIEVPQAYLNFKTANAENSSIFELTAGRRKETWSSLDLDWTLGLWEPLNRFYYLQPTEQGLTGIFADWKYQPVATRTPLFETLAFISPLYIPEQGASYQLQNGTFTSNSPWFSKPPDAVELLPGKPVSRIDFEIEAPSAGSVVSKFSAGFLLRTGHPRGEDGFYAQAAAIRKPRNQLSTPFQTILRIVVPDSYGEVQIYPRVEFHRLYSAEFGYRIHDFAVGVAGLYDDPEVLPPPVNSSGSSDGMTYQVLRTERFLSPYIEYRPFAEHEWAPKIKLSSLHTNGGQADVLGFISNSSSIFGSRAMYKRAVSLEVQSLLWQNKIWRFEQSLHWIEETSEHGTIVIEDLRASYRNNWRAAILAQLLGSSQPLDDTNTFIARYRDNGSVSALFSYAF